MMPAGSLLLAAALAGAVHAASMEDFAYGYALETQGDGAIYGVDLPQAVYGGLTRADGGDLRVFNGAGEAVPHHIEGVPDSGTQALPPVALPLFPLYGEAGVAAATDERDVRITTDEGGTIVDISYGEGLHRPPRLRGYIIDGSGLPEGPRMLTVEWPAGQGDLLTTVRLEHSADLTHWRPLVEEATLSHLRFGDHTLVQQRIQLPAAPATYLRLGFQGGQPFEIARLQAHFPERPGHRERRWTAFAVTHRDDQGRYGFDTRALLPVDRANLALPRPNTLARVRIESAPDPGGPWTRRHDGLVYDLKVAGQPLTTPDIRVAPTTHRHWRVDPLGEGGLPEAAMELRLGWVPERLLFVAQGEGPFVLAYGSGRVGRVDTPLSRLMEMEEVRHRQLVRVAGLGPPLALGDRSRLEPPPPPMDWKRLSLWAVLALGVALLAWMALRLYRDMERGP